MPIIRRTPWYFLATGSIDLPEAKSLKINAKVKITSSWRVFNRRMNERGPKPEFLGFASHLGFASIRGKVPIREFLDKFGRGFWSRIFWKINEKEWTIEYGLLVSACRLSKENPEALKKITEKAKNKKELRCLLGIS